MFWVAIPGASCANREAPLHLHQTDLDGRTHTHARRSQTQMCFLTLATSPDTSSSGNSAPRDSQCQSVQSAASYVFFEKKVFSRGAELGLTYIPLKLALLVLFCLVFDKIKSNYYLDIIFFER